MFPSNDDIEDMEHFLLLCPSFDMHGKDLSARVTDLLLPFVEIINLRSHLLIHLLLHGDQNFPNELNKHVIELTLRFIHEIGRFK